MVLERVGLFPGAQQYVADAVEQLNRRRDKLIMDGNPAQVLARQIARTIPVAYGGGDLGAAAAYRFKCQVNENAKAPAFSAGVPEMCHNELRTEARSVGKAWVEKCRSRRSPDH